MLFATGFDLPLLVLERRVKSVHVDDTDEGAARVPYLLLLLMLLMLPIPKWLPRIDMLFTCKLWLPFIRTRFKGGTGNDRVLLAVMLDNPRFVPRGFTA